MRHSQYEHEGHGALLLARRLRVGVEGCSPARRAWRWSPAFGRAWCSCRCSGSRAPLFHRDPPRCPCTTLPATSGLSLITGLRLIVRPARSTAQPSPLYEPVPLPMPVPLGVPVHSARIAGRIELPLPVAASALVVPHVVHRLSLKACSRSVLLPWAWAFRSSVCPSSACPGLGGVVTLLSSTSLVSTSASAAGGGVVACWAAGVLGFSRCCCRPCPAR